MVTMLDCINRVPSLIEKIITNEKELYKELKETIKNDKRNFNEIYLIGSGSSNTAAYCTSSFIEKVTGLQTQIMIPNKFLDKSAYNPNAIYLYTSQTGTSSLVRETLLKAKEFGGLTISTTESAETPIAKLSDIHVDMCCGYEEYWMRTIGFCTSVMSEMMIGLNIGLALGKITDKEYQEYLEDAKKVIPSHKQVSEKALVWMDKIENIIANGDGIMVYGPGPLWGIALECALKTLETAKHPLVVGYEMDDGLHGPSLGIHANRMVVILNDGGKNKRIMDGLANYTKQEFAHGFIVGRDTQDEFDLPFEPQSKYFYALEFAPVVQILAYRLGLYYETPVLPYEQMIDPTEKYFQTHDDQK